MPRGMNNLQANLCLLTVTFCWSCEVILFSVIPDDVSPFATTCVTSLIGAILLGACFARRIFQAFARDGWRLARRIAILSIMNTTYNVLFIVGLDYFDVSTGAFTYSLIAVVLPVVLLIMRRGVGVRAWISAACVLAGIVVSISSTFGPSQIEGLLIMGAGSLLRAVYIVKLNDYAREHDPLTLASGMSAMNAVFAFLPWLVTQPSTFAALPWSKELIAVYFIYGYFVMAFTTALNILAQRHTRPDQASVIYSTEIVFSTIWATCLPASIVDPVELTLPIVVGCALIVLGNLVEVIPIGPFREEVANPPEDAAQPAEIEVAQTTEIEVAQPPQAALGARPLMRKAALIAALIAIYLVIAIPFKVLEVIPGFTDIRPVMMLQPVYGIFFGIPGCLANAVGNLIVDIVSGALRWSSIAGFVANLIYPYLMYLFWAKLSKEPFSLRRGRTIGLFVLSVAFCALLQSLIISPSVAWYYPDVDATLFAVTVLGNGALFPIVFSIPLIIVLQEEFGLSAPTR